MPFHKNLKFAKNDRLCYVAKFTKIRSAEEIVGAMGIDWPIDSPTLSEKDSRYPELKDISGELLPVY